MPYSRIFLSGFCLALMVLLCSCSGRSGSQQAAPGPGVAGLKVYPFNMEDVKLKEGPYLRATELNRRMLLDYEPDRLLAKFRSEAGLVPRAEHYHGWEDYSLAGHSLGHYLSAICLMYESTGDPEFKERAIYITDELGLCQLADGEGYMGAFPDGKRILEEEVARGNIKAQAFYLNGIWAPFYTQHKVMSGLLQVYRVFEYEKALELNINFANWLYNVLKDLPDEKIQEMLQCEHGGINEALAELYGHTGNDKYLELSRIFQHRAIIDPITEGRDVLAGMHANTQIPKFVGLARRYELTGDESDKRAAANFWSMMVHHHSYVTGGNGNHEYLFEPDRLNDHLSDQTTESCNVYNMLRLTEHMFEWTADPGAMDFYERALLNHIRASQHPQTGQVIYNLSLDMGGFKVYEDPLGFTCCVGTGMESHAKYSKNIYYHNREELYAVQFISSELSWREKGVKIIQETDFPEKESINYHFELDRAVRFDFFVRYPFWASQGIKIVLNGREMKIKQDPGSFVKISRRWKTGDRVKVTLPFELRAESMPDNGKRIAIFNGPLLLAGDLGPDPDPASTDPLYVPVLMTDDTDPAHWLLPVDGTFNSFRTSEVAYPRQVELRPFYKTHNRHYTVYWDTYTADEWRKEQERYARELQAKKELESKTVDLFRIGEMQPERDHDFRQKDSWVEEYRSRKARTADRGGWFSFRMEVPGREPVSLSVEYWGGYTGSKTFDILVEGERIATENISNIAPGKFIDVSYRIPDTLIWGKSRIKVEFMPHEGHRAGPVFTVRTIREKRP